MARPRDKDRRSSLLEQRRAIDEQLRKIEARQREQDRKDDTRRKVIAGALALEDMQKNPDSPLAARLRELLHDYVEPRSRHLFAFLPKLDVRSEANIVARDMMAPPTAPDVPAEPVRNPAPLATGYREPKTPG